MYFLDSGDNLGFALVRPRCRRRRLEMPVQLRRTSPYNMLSQ